MTRTLAWVLGKGGLLGSRLAAALATRIPGAGCWSCPVPQFAWEDGPLLAEQLERAAAALAGSVQGACERWMVLWAAGAGVVGSPPPVLETEARAWRLLLDLLDRHRDALASGGPGLVYFSSSAGGVYGNSPESPLTEASPCHPVSAYGRHKLRLEEMLTRWSAGRGGVVSLIGRISNLYGPGQNLAKPQGLISHLSRCLIHQRPIHLYVPLDTIRDYLFVDDAAVQILDCCRELFRAGRDGVLRKIFASEESTSLAQIVGVLARVGRRPPRIVCGRRPGGSEQPAALHFRSTAWPRLKGALRTTLPVGIDRVHRHQLQLFALGRLPAPG